MALTTAHLFSLMGCAPPASLTERQGLFGTFKTYRLPEPEKCAEKFTTQEDLDLCKSRNHQRILEPVRGSVLITSLDADRGQRITLDSSGSYRQELKPGYYTVCLGKSCSDAIEVRLHTFVAYGSQYPRESLESILKGDPDRPEDSDTVTNHSPNHP